MTGCCRRLPQSHGRTDNSEPYDSCQDLPLSLAGETKLARNRLTVVSAGTRGQEPKAAGCRAETKAGGVGMGQIRDKASEQSQHLGAESETGRRDEAESGEMGAGGRDESKSWG